jgi:methionyl aminopeptidase
MIGVIHTSSNLKLLRDSASIVGKIHKELKKVVVPGIQTKELDSLAEEIIYSSNYLPAFKGYRGYPYTTCISVNNTIVHGFPSNYILRDGDVLSIDVGAYRTFYGDAAFTMIVGEANNKIDTLLVKTTESCLMKAIGIAKEGTTVGAIGNIIETTANIKGFDVVKNFVGHGIGRRLHEFPQIQNYGKLEEGLVLKSGMCICIEPMLVYDNADNTTLSNEWAVVASNGNNAAHFEHQIIIHKDKAEIISI